MRDGIIRETCSEIRAIARVALSGNWIKVFWGVFIFEIFTMLIPGIFGNFPEFYSIYYLNGLKIPVPYGTFIYMFFFSGTFNVGLNAFMITFFRRRELKYGCIFDAFSHYFKTFALYVLYGSIVALVVFVPLFIFINLRIMAGNIIIIPLIIIAVVISLMYSQAFFILADNPKKGVIECMRESRLMMTGNKGKLFLLELSFIGWLLLSGIPYAIMDYLYVPTLTYNIYVTIIIFNIVEFIAIIPIFFVRSYMLTAETAFYELATGNLVARPEPILVEDQYHFNIGKENEKSNGTDTSEEDDKHGL